jgi:hypothetical protein
VSEPYYYLAVNTEVLDQDQLSPGAVYLLPAAGFERERPYVEGDRRVLTAHAASLTPVEPLAKPAVEPADFRCASAATAWPPIPRGSTRARAGSLAGR